MVYLPFANTGRRERLVLEDDLFNTVQDGSTGYKLQACSRRED